MDLLGPPGLAGAQAEDPGLLLPQLYSFQSHVAGEPGEAVSQGADGPGDMDDFMEDYMLKAGDDPEVFGVLN